VGLGFGIPQPPVIAPEFGVQKLGWPPAVKQQGKPDPQHGEAPWVAKPFRPRSDFAHAHVASFTREAEPQNTKVFLLLFLQKK
jgi:hypothetical protein